MHPVRMRQWGLLILVLVLCREWSIAASDIVISEILVANSSGLLDDRGDYSPWIELQNRGDSTVNLAGWSLSNDPLQPTLWVFPNVHVQPGQFTIIFADGREQKADDGGPQHTNFKLDDSGDFLALYSPESLPLPVFAFSPKYPPQRVNISYGLGPSDELVYFATPTPRASNAMDQAFSGFTDKPNASVPSGYYDAPLSVTLTSKTVGAMIYFTLDGSQPSPSNGQQYASPIPISSPPGRGCINLRAIAVAAGLLPSNLARYTYIFPSAVLAQSASPEGFPAQWGNTNVVSADYELDPRIINDDAYSALAIQAITNLPTLSIAMDPADLFDPAHGIYSNTELTGDAWERSASVEFILPGGAKGFKEECGISIQGGSSTVDYKSLKQSFRIDFKQAFGDTKLDYALFADSPVHRFDTFILDGHNNFTWLHPNPDQRRRAQYVRDPYVSDLLLATGQPGVHSRFVNLYLNGLYWGLYDLHERPDASFSEEYFGGQKEDYDVFRHNGDNAIQHGNYLAWNAMMDIARGGLADNANYEAIQQYLDVTDLADYMIVNLYVGNDDWPRDNWYASRLRSPEGRFRFYCWDSEITLTYLGDDRTGVADPNGPAELYSLLRQNAEFRLLFADRVQKHFQQTFFVDPDNPGWDLSHPERNSPAALYLKRTSEIEAGIVLESARWGDARPNVERPGLPYEKNVEWQAELNRLLTEYFPQRSRVVLEQFKQAGLYPTNSPAPRFNNRGGSVSAGFVLTMTAPEGTIYFTTDGSDPRVYGSGEVSSHAQTYTTGLPLNGYTVVKARTIVGSEWSALSQAEFLVGEESYPLRITEIMYHPQDLEEAEFIELYNSGSVPLDLSGVNVHGVDFIYPPGTTLPPHTCSVLVQHAVAFSSRYPGVKIDGVYSGQLSNKGETIEIRNRNNEVLLTVPYGTADPWSPQAGGQGLSLQLRDLTGGSALASSWTAGAPNPGRFQVDLRIASLAVDTVGNLVLQATLAGPGEAELQVSPDLADWQTVQSTNTTAATVLFTIPIPSDHSAAFYRVVLK